MVQAEFVKSTSRFQRCLVPEGRGGWGGGTPCSEQQAEATPERGFFCALAVYESVGRFAVLCKKVAEIHLKLKEVAAKSKY